MMVRNGASALLTCSQYERPNDPPPKPEYVSVTLRVIDVPGVHMLDPVIDND